MRRRRGSTVLLGLVSLVALVGVVSACHSGTPKGNYSTVSPLPSSSVTSGSTTSGSTTPPTSPTSGSKTSPGSPYPTDVPLTGKNVKRGEKPPIYPDGINVKGQDNADAFARFFFETLDWAYATTNANYMKHYYGPSCGLCDGLASDVTKTAAAKHWYLGGRFVIHNPTPTAVAPVTAKADYCSLVTVDTTATSVVDKTGHVFNGTAPSSDRLKICMTWSDRWTTTYLAAA